MDFKIKYPCPQCQKIINAATGYLDNSESIELKCPDGHETTAFIAIPRFAIYFNKGIEALANNYYYEGYSWIYTALEVYRKDFVKAYLNVLNKVSIELIDQTFDKRFKSSENIYGAYAFAYLSYFGVTPDVKSSPYPILANEEVKRRNDMFHAGKMPSLEDIMNDCFKIYQHMFYGNQKFITTSGEINFRIIMEYYGARYVHWISDQKIKEEDITSGKIAMLNSDMGVFDFNIEFLGEIPHNTIEEIIEESKKRAFFYN
jgi:hypothetical protein